MNKLRGFRKKANDVAGTNHANNTDNGSLPFVNQHGRHEGLRAHQDLRASLGSLKNVPPDSPVKQIARKINGIPPALESISSAKDAKSKDEAAANLQLRMDSVQSAVDLFLEKRRADLEASQQTHHHPH